MFRYIPIQLTTIRFFSRTINFRTAKAHENKWCAIKAHFRKLIVRVLLKFYILPKFIIKTIFIIFSSTTMDKNNEKNDKFYRKEHFLCIRKWLILGLKS